LHQDRRLFLQQAALSSLGLLALPQASASMFSGIATADEDDLKADLIFRTRIPRNAEPPLPKLVESWITPNRLFYVRSHAPNPVISRDSFRLQIDGLVQRDTSFSLAELEQKFTRVECTCTMTCAGNRRYEHSKVKTVGGVQWEEGPIGNAVWSGFRLSDVLKAIGLQDAAEHVWFEGLDQIQRGDETIPFGGSVPVSKMLQDADDMPGVLLATHMNGVPLPIDHGFPLRTVVPGYIGARSVKWLGRITVSNRPSPNHYVATAYKLVQTGSDTDWAEAGPIYRFIVNSAICSADLTELANGRVTVGGYALPTGLPDTSISGVELSADGGQTWQAADLDHAGGDYCWTLWSATVNNVRSDGDLLLRAADSSGRIQPVSVPWNAKGYMYNAWQRVPVSSLKSFSQ